MNIEHNKASNSPSEESDNNELHVKQNEYDLLQYQLDEAAETKCPHCNKGIIIVGDELKKFTKVEVTKLEAEMKKVTARISVLIAKQEAREKRESEQLKAVIAEYDTELAEHDKMLDKVSNAIDTFEK